MSPARRSWWIPAVALTAILGSGAWMLAAGQGIASFGPGAQGWGSTGWGSSMMGGGWTGSDSDRDPVTDLTDARSRAQEFARDLGDGLGVGEVMQFDNQYYAEITAPDGALATEVLVDPSSGGVAIEYGPARMWNIRYGMMGAASGMMGGATSRSTQRIGAAETQRIADQWLDDRRAGLTADSPEALPGYYTLHTLRDGEIDGMLSVNAATGDVWYHSWHGQFVDMSEAP